MAVETKYRTCNLCEAICGLEITVEDNTVLSIRGDEKDTFSRGHICPKAVGLKDLHEDPDRLKKPLIKKDGEWIEATWDEAIKHAARSLVDIQIKYSKDAVAVYQGNPSVHNLGTSLFSPDFVRSIKTKNRYSATSVDQLGHHLAAETMFGNGLFVPVPDINRTDLWVIIGGNPMVSNGSMMTAPDIRGRIRDIQEREGRIIVIDPRYTETSEKADEHIFIKPGTDIWLLMGMLNFVIANDKINLGHLADAIDYTKIEAIAKAVESFDLDLAAAKTKISKERLSKFYTDFCNAKRAVLYGRLGISANKFGGLCHWAINTLNILTGNFDTEGGAMFTNPAVNVSSKKSPIVRFGRWHSRVRNLPEYGGELPSSTLAEDILEPGDGQIKALFTSCGNPVLSVPNGRKLDEAFESLDFMVSVDIYLNETTRHADVILPPATGLETPHYPIGFHNLAIHNTANYSDPAVEKSEGSLYDWEIFSRLKKEVEAYRLEITGEEKSDKPEFTLEQKLGFMLQFGPHKLSLEELKKHPHGIDLGALEPQLPERIITPDGKLNIYPTIYETGVQNLINSHDEEEHEFLLIGRRNLRSNNSWMHNLQRMTKGPNTCTALVHPEDAEAYNIKNGDNIKIRSRITAVEIEAEVSDEIMKGTISIPHGWGHDREGIRLHTASAKAGVSFNDLADDQLVDELSGVSVINAIPVSIEL
jgi:anaerobic selenocysteine-containing dehydrogenase